MPTRRTRRPKVDPTARPEAMQVFGVDREDPQIVIIVNGDGMASDPITTISVHASTRKLLASVKASGESYDDLLRDLLEERYPPEFLSELKRRASRSRRYPAETVFAEAGV